MKRADELIEQFLDSIGNSSGGVYVELFKSWKQIAGDRLADHARPVDVQGSSLIVETDHPGWSQMVIMNRSRILKQLAKRFPQLSLTGITVHLAGDLRAAGPRSESPSRKEQSPPPPRPPSADEQEALDRIADNELKAALGRLRGELDEHGEQTEPDT